MLAPIVAALLTATPAPDALTLAARCQCQTAPDVDACARERRPLLEPIVRDLLDVTQDAAEDVPAEVRLVLLAVACRESSYSPAPTCGADPAAVAECAGGLYADPRAWHRCVVEHGGRRGCSDSGRAAGMFQLHRWAWRDMHPEHPHDHVAAARWYVETLARNVRTVVPRKCGRRRVARWTDAERWAVAAYRLGRGPRNADGSQRCAAYDERGRLVSIYVRWAVGWYGQSPDAWRLGVEDAAQND